METSNQVVQEFLQEAAMMKQFHHPNVMSVFGVSMDENKPCIILPLMENRDLKQYLTHNKLVSRFLFLCFILNLSFTQTYKQIM